jgi:hypothetical protein
VVGLEDGEGLGGRRASVVGALSSLDGLGDLCGCFERMLVYVFRYKAFFVVYSPEQLRLLGL